MRDIQGHWAQQCIEQLVQRKIFSGYRDGTFRPENSITRAEFATILCKAFTISEKREAKTFPDVPNTHWAAATIQKAYRGGWLSGYGEGNFFPNQPMPRVQTLVALTAGLEMVPLHPPVPLLQHVFADAEQIPKYAIAGIAAALENHLVVNYPHRDRFNPLKPATRADVAAFVYQALVKQTGEPTVLPPEVIVGVDLATQALPIKELRGVWLTNIDSDVLFSREKLAIAMDRLAACRFNTLYPTIWNGGYTLFPSDVAESVLGERQKLRRGANLSRQEETQPGRDMLQECLELAHARGLKVIPWFEYGFFALKGNALRSKHPDWFTQQRNGAQTDSHNMEWLNPFHPEVQQFFLAMIDELVSRYGVDGFQVDDHFGLPTSFGYDPYTLQLYRSETGQYPPPQAEDEHWKRWRADKITDFVRQVVQTVKARRPQAIFSVSPNPPEFSYDNFLQDWPTWVRQGGVDEVVIQVYRWNTTHFVKEIERDWYQQMRQQVPISLGVLTGLKNRPMPLPILKEQCQAVRANGYDGMAFFFYETLWQTAGESPTVREGSFKTLFALTADRPIHRSPTVP